MVQSVERAFHILEHIADRSETGEVCSVSSISNALDLKIPTVHNLLKTLIKLGYVEQDAANKYHLGGNALRFGAATDSQLVDAARGKIESLVKQINETVILIIFHGDKRHTLLIQECSRELRVRPDSGANDNFCQTATGLSIMSGFSEQQLTSFIRRIHRPEGLCPFESEEELLARLAAIRECGYAEIVKEEYTVVGVPLISPELGLYASLGSFVPSVRYTPETTRAIISQLQQTADSILVQLQY